MQTGNAGLILTELYKRISARKRVSLEKKVRVRVKSKLSDKSVGFIFGLLSWYNSFTWDELPNTLLNTFGKHAISKNLFLIAHNIISTKLKFRPKLNET